VLIKNARKAKSVNKHQNAINVSTGDGSSYKVQERRAVNRRATVSTVSHCESTANGAQLFLIATSNFFLTVRKKPAREIYEPGRKSSANRMLQRK